jgi:hypothetical protein
MLNITKLLAFFFFAFIVLDSAPASAQTRWTSFSTNDLVFGGDISKYSCWKGTFEGDDVPMLQVSDNDSWIDVAKGVVLPDSHTLELSCSEEFPVAIGYQWTLNLPTPPSSLSTNLYEAVFRQKLPDITEQITTLVDQEVEEEVEKTKLVTEVIKEPYIKTISAKKNKKNAKKRRVIAYRNVKVQRVETYTVLVKIVKRVPEVKERITPGYISSPVKSLVYPSSAARIVISDFSGSDNYSLFSFSFSKASALPLPDGFELGLAYLSSPGIDGSALSNYSEPVVFRSLGVVNFASVTPEDIRNFLSSRIGSSIGRSVIFRARGVIGKSVGPWSNGIRLSVEQVNRIVFTSSVPEPSSPTPSTPSSTPSPTPTPEVQIFSIFGRPYQDSNSTWYVPITNSRTELLPDYSSLQVRVAGGEWSDVGARLNCGNYGCGLVVSGYVDVCPEFRLVATTGGRLTKIWTKGPSSGGTC